MAQEDPHVKSSVLTAWAVSSLCLIVGSSIADLPIDTTEGIDLPLLLKVFMSNTNEGN